MPTRPQQNWQYAVNIGDERFIRFWLNQYLRPKMWQGMYDVSNLWWGLDESAFFSGLYGVLDDNNRFVAGVPWDAPFPQTTSAYSASVATFFNRVKALAPDVRLMPNLGSLNDPNQISTISRTFRAWCRRAIMKSIPQPYSRNAWIPYFDGISWFGAQGRVMIMRALISQFEEVQNAYALYQLLKGPQFFLCAYGRRDRKCGGACTVCTHGSRLGKPAQRHSRAARTGMGVGYQPILAHVRWRDCLYELDRQNQDHRTTHRPCILQHFGSPIQQITMTDATGAYVSTTATAKAAKPEISPRLALPTNGPLNISLKSDTAGAAIYYTLDGSTPTTASLRYVGPFSLSNNATVKAIATAPFLSDSTVGSAAYTINGTLPRVQIYRCIGQRAKWAHFPSVIARQDTKPERAGKGSYFVTQPNGSTTNGSVTFLPGESYRYFSATAAGATNTITRVAITSLTNAINGTTTQYTYTVSLSTTNPRPAPLPRRHP